MRAAKKLRTMFWSLRLPVSSYAWAFPTISGKWKLAWGKGKSARSSWPTLRRVVKTQPLKRRAVARWSGSFFEWL